MTAGESRARHRDGLFGPAVSVDTVANANASTQVPMPIPLDPCVVQAPQLSSDPRDEAIVKELRRGGDSAMKAPLPSALCATPLIVAIRTASTISLSLY